MSCSVGEAGMKVAGEDKGQRLRFRKVKREKSREAIYKRYGITG